MLCVNTITRISFTLCDYDRRSVFATDVRSDDVTVNSFAYSLAGLYQFR